MNDEHWTETYDYAVRLFGQAPRPHDEEQVLEAFARSPAHVKAQIEAIAETETIRWKWSALAARLDRAKPSRELVVSKAQEREHRIEAAKHWIRHAGCHMTEDEVEAELFAPAATTASLDYLEQLERDTRDKPGRRLYDRWLQVALEKTRDEGPQPIPMSEGLLAEWANDTKLRDELMALWREARPAGERAEQEALNRAQEWKDSRQRLRELVAKREADLMAKTVSPTIDPAAGDFPTGQEAA